MKTSLIPLIVVLLALTALGTAAGAPAPGPFSTTGYTTNLVRIDEYPYLVRIDEYPYLVRIDEYPYLVPISFEILPSGYAKFHLHARGGPAYEDDSLCQELYLAPCATLCEPFGAACGAAGYFEGSFAFDELGLVDPLTGAGSNMGLLTVTTETGRAHIHFGGTASAEAVGGSFSILDGSREYRKLAGDGVYAGNAGYVFRVDYQPCGDDDPLCPAERCAVRGESLKLKNARVTWELVNDGARPVVLESLLLHWPEANGALTGVRLGGKTLTAGSWSAPWVRLNLSTAPERDRQLRPGKRSVLNLEFAARGSGEIPADYAFLAEFSGGCTALHVAFP